MAVYYQEETSASNLSGNMTKLERLGYTIYCVQPCFSQNGTSYIIVYYRK
jgi:hypothetical protein